LSEAKKLVERFRDEAKAEWKKSREPCAMIVVGELNEILNEWPSQSTKVIRLCQHPCILLNGVCRDCDERVVD
jgi:hypothetical protein